MSRLLISCPSLQIGKDGRTNLRVAGTYQEKGDMIEVLLVLAAFLVAGLVGRDRP
ncbi:MAG: hypothetical protein IPM64_04845 [Phycisphaerales bacterium]|nr:hypothetical protein [Phycisphaerales bacterium]